MRVTDELARSRPTSRLKKVNENPTGCSIIGDDVETVKNSMINLLNVVIEGGVLDEDSKHPPARKLVEVS